MTAITRRVAAWQGGAPLPAIAALGLGLLVVGAVLLYVTERLSLLQATVLIGSPLIIYALSLRPAWVVLGLLAVPPGLLSLTSYSPLILLLLVTLAAQLLVRGRVYAGPNSGLYPFLVLVSASLLFRAEVNSEAALAADTLLKQLLYYALLGLVGYNATRIGDLKIGSFINALLVGIWATIVLKVVISGLGPVPYAVGSLRTDVESLFFGRDFAFFAVMGFAIYFARWLYPAQVPWPRIRPEWAAVLSLLLLGLTLLSLVRAAWLAIVLVIFLIAKQGRPRAYWLLLLLAIAVILSVPIARERITPSAIDPASDITSGRWPLWTKVWTEEAAPALPWGNGFGHAWSITPEKLFGFNTFQFEGVDATDYLYLHNDFLFWIVEFGVLGLLLMVIFWTRIISLVRRLLDHTPARAAALMLVGTIVVMFVNHLFGNAYAFRPVSERFFVTVGCLYGLSHLSGRGGIGAAAQTDGRLQDA